MSGCGNFPRAGDLTIEEFHEQKKQAHQNRRHDADRDAACGLGRHVAGAGVLAAGRLAAGIFACTRFLLRDFPAIITNHTHDGRNNADSLTDDSTYCEKKAVIDQP